jgi:hypothetical protein
MLGLAVAPSGDVFVADLEGRCVWRVGQDGKAEQFDRSDPLWAPTGIAADGDALLVLEYGKGVRVRRLTPDGRSTTVATVEGLTPAGISPGVLLAGVALLAAVALGAALLWRRVRARSTRRLRQT